MIYHCMMPPETSLLFPAWFRHRSRWFQETPLDPTKKTYSTCWPKTKTLKKPWVHGYQLLWWRHWYKMGKCLHVYPMLYRSVYFDGDKLGASRYTTKGPLWYHWFPGSRHPPGEAFPPELVGGVESHRNEQLGGKSHGFLVGKIHWSWEHPW